MFFNFAKFDLKNGILNEWKKFIVAFCTFVAFFLIHYLRVFAENSRLREAGENELSFTFIDFILTVLGGMKEFHYEDREPFLFPALWIFFFLLLLFFALYYPTNDLDGIGKNMLILSQNRKTWWFSKCLWCCCYVLTYFVLFYTTSFGMGLILGGEITLQPSEYAPYVMDAGMYIKNPPWNVLPGLILIPCVACGLALLQMLLTLCIRPIFAYVISCVLLLSSAYFSTPFLVGNYAMLFRTDIFAETGITLPWGVLAAFLLITASVVLGYHRMECMDILTRE